MVSVSIHFANSNDEPIFVQVDPWAGLYVLKKDGEIEIIAESATNSPSFSVQETNQTRILTLVNSTEYFVMKEGKRVHWTKYGTNWSE